MPCRRDFQWLSHFILSDLFLAWKTLLGDVDAQSATSTRCRLVVTLAIQERIVKCRDASNSLKEFVIAPDCQGSSHHLDVVLFSEAHPKETSYSARPDHKDDGLPYAFVWLRLSYTFEADCVYLHTTWAVRANLALAQMGKRESVKALKARSREIVSVCHA